ncbi:hypothetical protein [uncultured Paraglaciecola sp.]|uniref:hypothetical protein n=1 Tax=uncultured Paraglaciecola sp. TaxID=1765024 RepID=UPI00260DA353|nr:hypothetical protein [uncultured Paraglaciecola sp.]
MSLSKLPAILFCLFVFLSTNALARIDRNNNTCDIVKGRPLTASYGPWDYTNPNHKDKLPIVLGAHFTPSVERLIKGNSASIAGDIGYTLRAIPNYHRALYAISKYEMRLRGKLKAGELFKPQEYTAECYFKRALHMNSNDGVTHMLYAMHLAKLNRINEAEREYLFAFKFQPENPEIIYNLGLFYLDTNRIDKAKVMAKKAKKLGYPLNGLQKKLKGK